MANISIINMDSGHSHTGISGKKEKNFSNASESMTSKYNTIREKETQIINPPLVCLGKERDERIKVCNMWIGRKD